VIPANSIPSSSPGGPRSGLQHRGRSLTSARRTSSGRRELAHAKRVATIDQLPASIAHEIKQPLAAVVIGGNAALRWLTRDPPDIEEAKRSVERMIRDADRACEIVSRLRDLVEKNRLRKEFLDVNEAVREATRLAHSEAVRTGVTVRTQLASHLPRIEGDRVQLQQVLLNLIVNAIQAMSAVGDGRRDVEISTETIGSGGVRVGVRDTGPGLRPDSLPRLFEPFYTTTPCCTDAARIKLHQWLSEN
jgi:C4-dicarboxylate-specific signal transduction histidine kinase